MSEKITLKLLGHNQETAMREVVKICLGAEISLFNESEMPKDGFVISRAESEADYIKVFTEICFEGKQGKNEYIHQKDFEKTENQNMTNAVKTGFYKLFTELYGRTLPWGSQTGIRPALIASRELKKSGSPEGAVQALEKEYSVSREKARLAVEVALKESALLKAKPRRGISLYIGIPFCPTRCLYCSFVSLPLSKQKNNVEPYVDSLCREIEHVGNMIKSENVTVDSVYIGGGTPTSLSSGLLEKLFCAIDKSLPLEHIYEFTVEAGRADTITAEKLNVIKFHTPDDVRISINPQTLNNSVLQAIGRNHTAEEFEAAFNMARGFGFKNINCDLIAGLPSENEQMFIDSLNRLCKLNPENITVHTMCVKRAANLKKTEAKSAPPDAVCSMVSLGTEILRKNAYAPYYMYRQKDTLGGLENTGFAKKGYEGIYNIFMMEDISTVVGLGAGAVTKIINYDTNLIERTYNYKDPWEYVKHFDEVLNRKRLK